MATHNYYRSKGARVRSGLGWARGGGQVAGQGALPGSEGDVAPAEMKLSSGVCFQPKPQRELAGALLRKGGSQQPSLLRLGPSFGPPQPLPSCTSWRWVLQTPSLVIKVVGEGR